MTLTVLQDPHCSFCRRTAAVLDKLDWLHALRLPGVDGDLRVEDGRLLTRGEQLEELHAVDEHGRVERGYFAVRRIAAELPLLWPLVPLLYIPGIELIGEPAYRWVAHHRDLVTRLLHLD